MHHVKVLRCPTLANVTNKTVGELTAIGIVVHPINTNVQMGIVKLKVMAKQQCAHVT